MIIRAYQPDDLPTLHRIDRTCFPRGIAYSLAELRAYIERDLSVTLVAEGEEGRIGGFSVAQLERLSRRRRTPWRASWIGHIVTIDVLPEYRSRGIGTNLLQQMEGWLDYHGAEMIWLETATENLPAISFYRKHGYRVVGILRDYYAGGSDAYLMGKRLDG